MAVKYKKIVSFLFMILLTIFFVIGVIYILNYTINDNQTISDIKKYHVAVIVKSTTSAFWKSVCAGTNAAGTEYNLNVTFDGPAGEEDYETQNEMVLQAVKDGASVIVFSAVDFNANKETIDTAISQGVKVIVIDSDVNSEKVSCKISTDNYNAGYMAGEAALDNNNETLNIGIVNFDKNSANGQQREQGFRDAIAKDSRINIVQTINVISTIASAQNQTEEMMKNHPEINVIATFNEWTSLGVGYAIREMNLGDATTVIAFDSNAVCVGMLEDGDIDGLIVQDPYAMGYLGVEYAYNLINDIPFSYTNIDTKTTLVTKENMFEEASQRVLFPFI